jgi:hypothetical protein
MKWTFKRDEETIRKEYEDVTFWQWQRPRFILFAIAVIILCIFGSCRFQRDLQKSTDKTTVTTETTTTAAKVDTSKSTKEASYERVTYVYPPGDTTIINLYNSQGKAAPPTTVIVERGESKEVQQSFNYEQWWQHKQDSLARLSMTKDVKSDTKIGPSVIEWILIGGIAVILLKDLIKIKRGANN